MMKIPVLFVVVLFCNVVAFAQSNSEELTSREHIPTSDLAIGSNRVMREGKHVGMEVQLAGLEMSSTTAMQAGLRILSYQSSENQWGFQVQSANHNELSQGGSSDSLTETKEALLGRHFFSDTWFAQVGVEQKQVSASDSENSSPFSASVTSAIVSIGQQWQWKQFNFTMEWLGLAQPFVSTVTSSAASSSANLQSSLTQKASLAFLNFSVGANF